MHSQEAIDQQQKLLVTHRATLAHYLIQRAQLGAGYAPPGVTNGIAEARAEIRRIKEILRGWGVAVEDLPDDTEASVQADVTGTEREHLEMLERLLMQLRTLEERLAFLDADLAPAQLAWIENLTGELILLARQLNVWRSGAAVSKELDDEERRHLRELERRLVQLRDLLWTAQSDPYPRPALAREIADRLAALRHLVADLLAVQQRRAAARTQPLLASAGANAMPSRPLAAQSVPFPGPTTTGAPSRPRSQALRSTPTTAIGFFGLSLLLFGLGILGIAVLPVQRLRYTLPSTSPAPSPLGLVLSAMLVVGLIAALIGARLDRQRFTLARLLGSLLAVVLLVALALGLLVGLQNPSIAAAAERVAAPGTSAPTQPPAPTAPATPLGMSTPPYRAVLDVAGPTTMRAGTSATLALTITVAANADPQPDIPLTASVGYTATTQLQPGNFEVGTAVASMRDIQNLALGSPARWAWAIAPKDQRLGSQALVVDVFLYDRQHTRIGVPSPAVTIQVTDLLGLPPPIGYVIGRIASLLGAILSAIGIGAWIRARWLKTPDAAPAPLPQAVPAPLAPSALDPRSQPAANPAPATPTLHAISTEIPAPPAVSAQSPAVPASAASPPRRRKAKDSTDDR